jgi:DNA replication protein DnaC
MDDTEMGRPPRHGRAATKSEPRMTDFMRRGEGPEKRVRGSRPCSGCGVTLKVDFKGPADSLGVRLARARLDTAEEALCEKCGEDQEAAERAAEEQERTVALFRRRLDASGIPERWQSLTFDRLDQDAERAEAITAATEWGRGQRKRGVLLHGEVGRGKTVIAAAAAVERCAVGNVRWLSVADLLLDLRMPFDTIEYVRAMRRIDATKGRAALVLDDLDKLKPTEHALQPIYVAINGWIEAGLPMLVTLNRDVNMLSGWMGETFGPPIASRLSGYCDVIEVRGRDRRLA